LAQRIVQKTVTIVLTYTFNSNDVSDVDMQDKTIARHESRMQQSYPIQIGGVGEKIVMDSFNAV